MGEKADMRILPVVALLLMLSACATPERRIRAQPEEFAALTPEQQALVREGRIDLGFPTSAVELALGKPHRIFSRRTEAGETVVWSYVRIESRMESQWVDVRTRRGSETVRVDVENSREVETLRLELQDGRLSAIENLIR